MARKLELDPADIPANVNIIDKITARRRERHGLAPLPPPENITEESITSNITGKSVSQEYDNPVILLTDAVLRSSDQSTHTPGRTRADRLNEIRSIISDSSEIAVTLKLPSALNEYLNDYVYHINRHRAGKRKVLKQECIAEALANWYADHPLPEDGK